jgi:hypothetical protein
MTGVSISIIVFFNCIDRLLAKLYSDEYEKHGISQLRFLERSEFLAYALFLKKVKKEGYTPDKLKVISDYSETLSPPPKPFLINQHFLSVMLLSGLVTLSTSYIQKTSGWPNQGLFYIWVVASLAVLVCLTLDGLRASQTQNARVRRYMQRAQIELEQETLDKCEETASDKVSSSISSCASK